MKMKILFFIILMLPVYNILAAPEETEEQKRIVKIENEITSLQQTIKELKQNNNCQTQLIQNSNSGISAQLTSATWFVGITGLIIAAISVFLGIFIHYRVKESYETLKQNEDIKQKVDDLNLLIKESLDGLYLRIKEEETKHIISRLKNVPEDVANLHTLLASRDLSKEHYQPLKESYLKLGRFSSMGSVPHVDYLLLFFQHYAGLTLFDINLKKDFESAYRVMLGNAFKNDIIKSTADIITSCVNNDLSKQQSKLIIYLTAITRSEYAELEGLYKTIFNKLINKENQFLLYELINKTPTLGKVRYHYGKIIKNYYEKTVNTISQKLILREIDELIQKLDKGKPQT